MPLIPIGEEARWALKPVWTLWSAEKSLAPTGNQTPVIQAVSYHYTD
jgi:hypothetical protein